VKVEGGTWEARKLKRQPTREVETQAGSTIGRDAGLQQPFATILGTSLSISIIFLSGHTECK